MSDFEARYLSERAKARGDGCVCPGGMKIALRCPLHGILTVSLTDRAGDLGECDAVVSDPCKHSKVRHCRSTCLHCGATVEDPREEALLLAVAAMIAKAASYDPIVHLVDSQAAMRGRLLEAGRKALKEATT